MQTTINIDIEVLDQLGITTDEFQQVASYALSNLSHPTTGEPIYFNGVQVTVVADCPEVACN